MYTKNYIKNFIKDNHCGIMFHHFCEKSNINPFKGSFSQSDFESLLLDIGIKNIVSPSLFLDKINKQSRDYKCCITFDDGLKSQFKIALPILEKYNIKAFWFVYTSIFDEKIPDNEVTKYLINKFYPSLEDYLIDLKKSLTKYYPMKKFKIDYSHDKHIKFFTPVEREYRYIRDIVLTSEEYQYLNKNIFSNKVNIEKVKKKIFLEKKNINYLIRKGHYVGLHSHTHPMNITKLSYKEQFFEYQKCQDELNILTNYKSNCMSHPNNYYNRDTLKVLKKLGVDYGFTSQTFEGAISKLEIPRVDCCYLR